MTPLLAVLSLAADAPTPPPPPPESAAVARAEPQAPAAGPATAAPAATRQARLPGPPDAKAQTRYRCKVAGAVLLATAGAAIVSVLSLVVYRAAATPEQVTLEAGPRLGLGLSSIALTVAGSALLGYGLSAPAPVPAGTLRPAPAPVAWLQLRF
ncbi:MAG: hypothetical protein U1A78_24025 [Polyangia bacterium]